MHPRRAEKHRTVAALDLGSWRISCLVARLGPTPPHSDDPGQTVELLALGQARSQGLVGGVVTDLEAAGEAVRAAIAQAEQQARIHISDVHLAVNSPSLRSSTFSGSIALPSGHVTHHDVSLLQQGALEFAERDGGCVISLDTRGYGLHGGAANDAAIEQPLGLAGDRLHGLHHAVTVDASHMSNLRALLRSYRLGIAGAVPAAAASAIAVTSNAHRDLGVTVMDFGSQLTTVASFSRGHLVHCDVIPEGGQHLTMDIARRLGCSIAEAERIKTLYGSLLTIASDEHQYVRIDGVSGSGPASVTRAEIVEIAQSRFRHLLGVLQTRIESSGFGEGTVSDFVITGGASQILGAGEYASQLTGWKLSAGVPGVGGNSSSVAGHVLSPCASGVIRSVSLGRRWCPPRATVGPGQRSYLGRMEQWLRDSF